MSRRSCTYVWRVVATITLAIGCVSTRKANAPVNTPSAMEHIVPRPAAEAPAWSCSPRIIDDKFSDRVVITSESCDDSRQTTVRAWYEVSAWKKDKLKTVTFALAYFYTSTESLRGRTATYVSKVGMPRTQRVTIIKSDVDCDGPDPCRFSELGTFSVDPKDLAYESDGAIEFRITGRGGDTVHPAITREHSLTFMRFASEALKNLGSLQR